MLNITTFLESYHKQDSNLNNINFIVNKLYNLNEIKKLVDNYIPISKFSNSIKGIVFYPEESSTKLIYLYGNCSQNRTDSSSPSNPAIAKQRNIRSSKIKLADSEITAVFKLKKADTVDVYTLHLAKILEKNGNKYAKYKKFGIAYIPTKECSYFCKDVFDKVNTDFALVKCKYVLDKDRWIPYEHVTDQKLPDNYSDVSKLVSDLE
jgi:hypothetical protein